jgi:hypothetical protein
VKRSLGLVGASFASFVLACSAPAIPAPVQASAAADPKAAHPNEANADPNLKPPIGPFDIQTVFHIEKSNDKDHIDYGMRLDQHCLPVGDGAVFPYWRELEHPPPVRSHPLTFMQYNAYGFSEQKRIEGGPSQGKYRVQLKHVNRPITIVTEIGPDTHCKATPYTVIQGVKDARLDRIFVKVAGFASADYVDVHGFHPQTGAPLVERLKP